MASIKDILARAGEGLNTVRGAASRAASVAAEASSRVSTVAGEVASTATSVAGQVASRASVVAETGSRYAMNSAPLVTAGKAVTSKAPSVGKSIYKAATSKYGTRAIIGGAVAAGMYNVAARPAMDATLDVAFDNPDADKEFTGGKLSPLIFGGGAIGGAASGAKMLSPQYTEDYAIPFNPAAGVGLSAAIGAGLGGMITRTGKGARRGALLGGAIATAGYAKSGHDRGEKSLNTAYGGSRRLDPNTMDYDWDTKGSDPREAYRNSSGRISQQMNSSGDIVLGMHNLRRG
jgi:hypothetical protein